MRANRSIRAAVVSALSVPLLIAAAVPAQADTRLHVENPNFNTPGVEQDGTHYHNVGVGSPAMPGWSVTHGNVDIYGRGFAKAPTGTQALSLNGGTSGTVIQTLETTPGSTVTVSWLQSPDTWSGCSTSNSQVYSAGVTDFNGSATELFNPGRPTTAGDWTRATLTFTASRFLTTLEFASQNGGGACGPLITHVVAHEKP
ncbi:DUF642 domain-containing protein [Streptomyces sp. TRM70350]|uniref:DUF642 domain-containing protein n=1 Tax=Streptomyces sp. TRM70350 TaxID=2856165 RepID=UPI001C48FD67|nr:DUF642 domain-containing protein [Streptomyces sp. TRM70350]MBV7695853.1 DUF642 domain-containing protein [Streptomyces sp. TRM70350]